MRYVVSAERENETAKRSPLAVTYRAFEHRTEHKIKQAAIAA